MMLVLMYGTIDPQTYIIEMTYVGGMATLASSVT
jgi:hypothetical protein